MLRALQREPETGAALLAELESARGKHEALDATIDELRRDLAGPPEQFQVRARAITERAAVALQAVTLLRGDADVAEAFCRSRLAGGRMQAFGTLDADAPLQRLVERAALPA